MLPLLKKKSGTPTSAADPKHTSCRFVRPNSILLLIFVRSFGTVTYAKIDMKHKQEEYWRPHFHAPPLRSHPDPPPTIQCSWYPHEGQCPYMRLALICWRSNGECTFTDMQKIEKRVEKRV